MLAASLLPWSGTTAGAGSTPGGVTSDPKSLSVLGGAAGVRATAGAANFLDSARPNVLYLFSLCRWLRETLACLMEALRPPIAPRHDDPHQIATLMLTFADLC